MHHFNPRRREILLGLCALLGSPKLLASAVQPQARQEFWLSAQGKTSDSYGLACIGSTGQSQVLHCALRGHGLAQNPQAAEQVVLFPRHPGRSAVVFNLHSQQVSQQFDSLPGNIMSGHGCYSADGQFLYCVEVNEKTGAGFISVRETTHFKTQQTFSSYGIGPHEIKLMPDRQTLVLANGGLINDANGKLLNPESIDSSLVYINRHSGALNGQYRVAEKTASLRHIDVDADGTVAIAMQLQREACPHQELVPLCAIQRGTQAIELLNCPEILLSHLQDYVGSVAINPKTGIAGFTSPRGNLACFWHIRSAQFAAYHSLNDVCGISVNASAERFLLSTSLGQLRQLDAVSLQEIPGSRIENKHIAFDNHLLTVRI